MASTSANPPPTSSSDPDATALLDDLDFFPTEPEPTEAEKAEFAPHEQQDEDVAGQEDDYDDEDGTLFSGPAAQSIPTSTSGFRFRSRSRGELDRLSFSYNRSSLELADEEDEAAETDDGRSTTSRRSRRSTGTRSRRGSTSHRRRRSSNAGSMSSKRPPIARAESTESATSAASGAVRRKGRKRSGTGATQDGLQMGDENAVASESEEEEGASEDPYGPYGSDTDSSSASTQSTSSSSDEGRRRGNFLGVPGIGGDLFGESRGDFDALSTGEGEEEHGGSYYQPGKGSQKAHQSIYIPDEDLLLHFVGLETPLHLRFLWAVLCTLTLGSLWLVGRWVPRIWIRVVGRVGDFEKAEWVIVESPHHFTQILPLKTIKLERPVLVSSLFPASVRTPPKRRDEVQHPSYVVEAEGEDGERLSIEEEEKKKYRGVMLRQGVRALDYRYYRFLLHPEGEFRMAREWKDPAWTSMAALRTGIPDPALGAGPLREALFGRNAIEIEQRGIVTLLMDEVLHPFYIFQVASILLWSLDDYYYYAFAIAVISVGSIIQTLIETRNNIERMREMSRFVCEVTVKRGSTWAVEDSSVLVPGDVVDVSTSNLNTFPADLVLLSGDAIVNESMLTGESVPVSKVPLETGDVALLSKPGGEIPPELSRHVVFSGTKIIRVRKTVPMGLKEAEATAIVLRTGFNTTKGALVRSMLFPKPFGFSFYRDSFRFIGVLACIAVVGFLASSVNFVKLGIAWSVIVIRALDLVTIVVPPALPATMSIGTSFAIARLRKAGIYCISPNRVNIGGKINIVCFDKTGTLTEEGLDVLGVRSVQRSTNKFTELITDAESVPIFGAADGKTPLVYALSTCHALKMVDGEVIGDPLDLKMFDFTKWTLEEVKEGGAAKPATPKLDKGSSKVPDRAATLVQTVVRPPGGQSFKIEDAMKAGTKHAHFLELGVLRTLDFVSALRRMSVLVKKLKSNSVEAYVKGAPEVMRDICDPASIPSDYDDILADYTKHGFRVIALAGKSMPGLTWVKAQRLKREQVESELRFLGLIIFENKLKLGTTAAISAFRGAHIPTRMVTGDNVRTAISVGRECGMIQPRCRVFLPTFVKGSQTTPRSVIEWTDVDNDHRRLDAYTLKPEESIQDDEYSILSGELMEYQLAVTGDVFRWMMDFGEVETLQRMLIKGVIFARMSPDEKHELVERLQMLGYTVGFCGDGANDCGALKAADVGLSLSEAEASVAAPFTSRQPDIRCFLEVIKEGRAALVTSFSCFKFMALYSLIQFTTVTLLYAIASTLGDFQFLYIDLFLILPIAVTMGRTEPFPRIHPKRPTANLVSKKVLASLVGQIFLTSAVQVFVFFYVRSKPWYVEPTIDPDELDIVSYENTALFLVSSFQYVLVAAIFCVGPPYRKPITSNRWLLGVLIALCLFSLFTLFTTHGAIFNLLQLISLPHDFHLELVLILIANVALSVVFEEWLALKVARAVGDLAKKVRRWRGKRKNDNGKIYKLVQRDLDD